MAGYLRRNAARVVALLVIVALYRLATAPGISTDERARLAARFSFTALRIPDPPGRAPAGVREVHPSLRRIAGWVSAFGAAVALNDLDGDGFPNDLCHVDPRFDTVTVAPVPGGGPRYAPVLLDPDPLPFDPVTTAPMGCLPGDFNEDGLMDLLVHYWGRTPVAFLGLGGLRYAPREVVGRPARWYTNAATQADLDGDGHLDLVLGNYFPDGARVLDPDALGREELHTSFSRAFNGGTNRLLRWTEGTGGPEPGVRFEEAHGVLDEVVARGWTLAVGAADLDGDLLPELYFANDFGPDRLLHNRSTPGRLRFALLEGPTSPGLPLSKALGHDSFKGMGVDFGDLDGDGLLDIYVSNIADDWALQESHFAFVSTGEVELMWEGVAPYADRSEPLGLARSGWGWDSRLADLDNDGVLEAVQATGFVKGKVNRWPELQELAIGNDGLVPDPRAWPRFGPGDDLSGRQANALFVRAASGRYFDVAAEVGLGGPFVSRGIATADVDGDGDLDLAVANQWEPSYLYRNDCPACGAFLGLHLLLPLGPARPGDTTVRAGHPGPGTPGRPAVGARAVVLLPDGRRLVAEVDGGSGHSGEGSFDLHFGLGGASPGDQVTVELAWRDPGGEVRGQTLRLAPGWHTVVLGWPKGTP